MREGKKEEKGRNVRGKLKGGEEKEGKVKRKRSRPLPIHIYGYINANIYTLPETQIQLQLHTVLAVNRQEKASATAATLNFNLFENFFFKAVFFQKYKIGGLKAKRAKNVRAKIEILQSHITSLESRQMSVKNCNYLPLTNYF